MKAKIETANNLEAIYFPVRLENTSELTGMLSNPECVMSVVATIDGQDRVLSTCGERYNLVSNEEVFTPIVEKLKGYDYEVQVTTRNHAEFEVKFNITDSRLAVKIGDGEDLIFPQISLNRSYDGGSKYNAHAGFFRLICSNGLVIPYEGQENNSFSAVGKHTEKLSLTLDKINSVVDRILAESQKVAKKYEVLFDTKVENFEDRVVAVMEATKINLTKENRKDVVNLINDEMEQLNIDTANDWLVYNGINSLIYKTNVKTDEVRKGLDKRVLDYMLLG